MRKQSSYIKRFRFMTKVLGFTVMTLWLISCYWFSPTHYISPVEDVRDIVLDTTELRDAENKAIQEYEAEKKKLQLAEAEAKQVVEEPKAEVFKNNVQKILEEKAMKYGVSYILLDAIVDCESDYNPTAKSRYSSATGIAQFINGTWKGYVRKYKLDWTLDDRKDPVKSADMLARIISEGGLHNWKADPASYKCWGWAEFK